MMAKKKSAGVVNMTHPTASIKVNLYNTSQYPQICTEITEAITKSHILNMVGNKSCRKIVNILIESYVTLSCSHLFQSGKTSQYCGNYEPFSFSGLVVQIIAYYLKTQK